MKRIAILLGLLLAVSCSSSRYVAADYPAIDNLTLVIPYSNVWYVEKGGEKYDEENSLEQQKMLTSILLSSDLPIKDTISVAGLDNQQNLDAAISFLPNINVRELDQLSTDGPLDELLDEHGSEYGLIIYSDGFLKDRDLYKREVAGAIVSGLVSAFVGGVVGGVTGVAVVGYITPEWKYGSSIYAMVIDTRNNKVVYYNKIKPVERNPMDWKVLSSQVEKLMKKFPRK